MSPRRQAQFVGERLGGGIEIGEVVAPALDLAAHRVGRVVAPFDRCGVVVEPGESGGGVRCSGQQFDHLVAVDAEVGEALVGQAPRKTVDAADRLVLAQAARIEVELLGELDHARARTTDAGCARSG